MFRFVDFVPDASNSLSLNAQTFVAYLLPAIASYYVMAVLVILPGTFPVRLALLPITLSLVFRVFISIDVVGSDAGYGYLGYAFGVGIIHVAMRAIEWSFLRGPLRRLPLNELNGSQASGGVNGHIQANHILGALRDACDLLCNLRGHGWNWAQGWRFPSETRPTSSTTTFVAFALLSAFKHFLLFDVLLTVIRSFSPLAFGSSVGGTIHDPSLTAFSRYARSTFISLISGFAIYAPIQMAYDVFSLIGVLIFQQRPAQWPPLFDSPWLSTSLTTCWSSRWHQLFRGSFIGIGAKPLSFFVGRVGGVMGAFLCSAVLHDWGLWPMGRGTEFWSVGGFFLMMGVGCVAEALFKKATGLKVGGWAGWFWTMSWVAGWANICGRLRKKRAYGK